MYDILTCEITCPHCGAVDDFDIEAFFPFSNLFNYKIGDEIKNITKHKIPKCKIYEGYTVCRTCERDFFLYIKIQDNKITSVENDKNKKGYIN
jgi:hypothetical protein